MACFLVPTAEAIVTTVVTKVVKTKEKDSASGRKTADGYKFSEKLGWLNGMLWGGSGLLAFEHLWHGEVVPFFPFLTNAVDPADRAEMLHEMGTSGVAEMLHEMGTSGVAMAVLVTLVWLGMVVVSGKIEEKNEKKSSVKGA